MLLFYGKNFVPKPSKSKTIYLPGWKDFSSDLNDMFRETYTMWKNVSSPRQGPLSNMKNRAMVVV